VDIQQFWKQYSEADSILKQQLASTIVDNILEASLMPDPALRRVVVTTLIISYLEDYKTAMVTE
jgi:hypothetical protein